MGQDIITGALALVLTFAPLTTPSATPNNPQQETVIKPQIAFIVVNKNDSLSTIAQREYGSGDYWTNIWNDNPQIKDPSAIEEGDKLKIEAKTPDKPAELKPELKKILDGKNVLAYVEPARTQDGEAPAPSPSPVAIAPANTVGPLTGDQINFLGNCESGMTASRNSGNGYYGAFQFSYGTWQSMGTGYERADLAPLDVQIDAVQRLVSRSSVFGQFPACSQRMRAMGIL